MIDIHSHVLFNVDDGPSNLEESVKMVREAERLGIQVIIATPHFQENIFNGDNVYDSYQELVHRVRNMDVEIKLGYEVFITPNVPLINKTKKRLTLNNTSYLLFEFPFSGVPVYGHETIYKLQLDNITPIIAHPERNRTFLKNFGRLLDFRQTGCLVQVDAASIAGVYGRHVRRFVKQLVKMDLVDFVASDAHYARDYAAWYGEAYNSVCRWAGKEYADRLFHKNAEAIVNEAEETVFNII
ncbi:MAG: phosphoesterase [Clostridiales bacterium]|jgi:protein-tyrosine phosphatase|nr:phosphoesterase [Eubacteriales bacterium]MDH7566516.1 phosphoesterase [Clostridiales bacterium]